ncbi:hypothetical protein TWF506_009590 [Arthrobotrys conoides]|uniref:Phosphorylase n=1 Tax=Arthrobotrys conoides TaxID=74498 RepID=A0AAN8N774_9PEZI
MASGAPKPHLEEVVIKKFDSLVAAEQIIWGHSEPEYVTDKGFQFEFRLAPALLKKPMLSGHGTERNNPDGSFADPDPNFVIGKLGETHTLIFSKFCVPRPHFVLHTNQFELQSDDLTRSDLDSAWQVLETFSRTPYMMIFNCGVDAGSSRSHKHMQFFPKPEGPVFKLFPDQAHLIEGDVVTIPTVPYKHYITALPAKPLVDDLVQRYNILVGLAKIALEPVKGTAHNVVMTKDWIMVIPRAWRGFDRAGANAAGMVGMVWVGSDQERQDWSTFGLTSYFHKLGLPQ